MKKRPPPTPFELAFAEHQAIEYEIKNARDVLRFNRVVRNLSSQVSNESGVHAIGSCDSAETGTFN